MNRLINASDRCIRQGYEYYSNGRVLEIGISSENEQMARVAGGENRVYFVKINPTYMRRSTCNCMGAKFRPVICKHMVATFFAFFPDTAKEYTRNAYKYDVQRAEYQRQHREFLKRYVSNMSEDEVRRELVRCLYEMDELFDGRPLLF